MYLFLANIHIFICVLLYFSYENPIKCICFFKRDKLKLHCALVQLPIGLEGAHVGVVDLIERVGVYFDGGLGCVDDGGVLGVEC